MTTILYKLMVEPYTQYQTAMATQKKQVKSIDNK